MFRQKNISWFVGNYEKSHVLFAYTDASKESYCTVLYLKNCETNVVPFLLSKSCIIQKSNSNSIPGLELQALTFFVKIAHCKKNMQKFQSRKHCRSCCFHWHHDSNKPGLRKDYYFFLQKKLKKLVVLNNFLNKFSPITDSCPMTFLYIYCSSNSVDFVTRSTSENILNKTKYFWWSFGKICFVNVLYT